MEHVNAEILRAIAGGKKVQYRNYCSPSGWEYFHNADSATCWRVLIGGVAVEWRIAPKTVKIGDYEVPEPCREPLKAGQEFWAVNPFSGPQKFDWDGSEDDYHALDSGFVHLSEEDARQHYEAIKSLLVKQEGLEMQTIYKTASLGISELSELATMKAQRAELDVKINKLEAALRKAGLESLKEVPVKWKVGDVVKCMCGDADFAPGRLYKIANISKDHIMLLSSPKKYKWVSVNNFKLIGGNHGTHSR